MFSRSFACTALASILTFAAPSVSASSLESFEIDPVTVTLDQHTKHADINVINNGKEELRFTLTGYAWTQDATNEMKLEESDDLMFYPEIFHIPPGAKQRVRVGMTEHLHPFMLECAYRVYLRQMPPLRTPRTKGPSLNVVALIGIPIFHEPTPQKSFDASIALSVKNQNVQFVLYNHGNAHLPPSTIAIAYQDAEQHDKIVARQTEPVWYILAGQERAVTLPIPQGACRSARTIDLQWHVGERILTARSTLTPGCP